MPQNCNMNSRLHLDTKESFRQSHSLLHEASANHEPTSFSHLFSSSENFTAVRFKMLPIGWLWTDSEMARYYSLISF